MSAILVRPLPFTVSSGNAATNFPVSYSNLDQPGLVWRSANLTTVQVVIDLGDGASYDTVAVIGSNLRASDTVQITTQTTANGLAADGVTSTVAYTGSANAAYSGTKDASYSTKSIYELPSTRSERYVKIDFVATSHPDGFVQAQRIVVGKAIKTEGIDADSEMTFVDQSVATNGAGFTSFDEYDVLPSWRMRMSWISDAQWRNEFSPFLLKVGIKKGFLFVPNMKQPTYWQHEAIFGRFNSNPAKGAQSYTDAWIVEGIVTAIAP